MGGERRLDAAPGATQTRAPARESSDSAWSMDRFGATARQLVVLGKSAEAGGRRRRSVRASSGSAATAGSR